MATETPRSVATSCRGSPDARSFPVTSTLPSVITLLRPPTRPSLRAACRPARVRSTLSTRSVSARLAVTWKKKRLAGVLVSMESVGLTKLIPSSFKPLMRSTSCLTLRPSRSSFQTTKVSPFLRMSSAFWSPGRSVTFPLVVPSKTLSHPERVSVSY